MSHTKGVWVTTYWIEQPNNKAIPMVAAGGVTIAKTHPAPICPMDECEANAKLIATAPELLEALESLVAVCEKHSPNGNPFSDIRFPQMDAAQAVIAKAKS